jgi:hypothetical protein
MGLGGDPFIYSVCSKHEQRQGDRSLSPVEFFIFVNW